MTEDQLRTINSFIASSRVAIKAHKDEYRDAASLRVMNYTVGRMEGAYCMLGNRCADANIHATVRQVHADFEAASLLTLR